MQLVDSPYWEMLKDVAYADEMSRLHLADEDAFNEKIKYAEDMQKSRGDVDAWKAKKKELIDGNMLKTWIPELSQKENAPYIGKLMKGISDWLQELQIDATNKGVPLDITQDDVKAYALELYNKVKDPETFQEFWNKNK
jgi:hypothetical protein